MFNIFVEKIINRSGLIKNVLENNDKATIETLFTFTNFIKKEAERTPRLSLNRLLDQSQMKNSIYYEKWVSHQRMSFPRVSRVFCEENIVKSVW